MSLPPSRPVRITMLPNVVGGIGHISRTASLTRALQQLDPAVEVRFVLDSARLRPFNVEATRRMGFEPVVMPALEPGNRGAVAREAFGDPDVVVDDVARYLLPLRRHVPDAAWMSILMHPVHDELFWDWPMMAQMDALIWPYAPLVGVPAEIEPFAAKTTRTGPFLETDAIPDRAAARAELGLAADAPHALYAPRGFPFGQPFGHRVLGAAYRAVEAMRAGAHPAMRLVLLAVSDRAELRGVPGLPDDLPDWVTVKGVVTARESLLHIRAADAVIGEGTSTMHEGAGLRTPLVLVPGFIHEAWLVGTRLGEQDAAFVHWIETVEPEVFRASFAAAVENGPAVQAMTARAHALITGGGGALAAARVVLDLARRHAARRAA